MIQIHLPMDQEEWKIVRYIADHDDALGRTYRKHTFLYPCAHDEEEIEEPRDETQRPEHKISYDFDERHIGRGALLFCLHPEIHLRMRYRPVQRPLRLRE